jgi:hypothetical protein
MAFNPVAVGACTAPPLVPVRPMGWRSKLLKKKSLFLMIGPPKVAP